MNNHEVIIKRIVLHILDTNITAPVLSQQEFDPGDREGFDFVENQIRKLLVDDNIKNVRFLEDSNRVKDLCESLQNRQTDFLTFSQEMAGLLYGIMRRHPNIPAADLICCQALIDDSPYVGLLKLNYRANFIHYVQNDGESTVNVLVKQKTVLPGENQKPEESVLINLEDFSIRLVEKEYEIDGQKEYYLSKQFLVCSDQLSTVQKAKIISKAAQSVSKKYQNEDFDSVARLRKTVAENMETSNAVVVESVAREIFRDNPAAQREYVEEVKRAGIEENEIQLSEKITERKFRSHKIKTDTGIEINFPSTYYNNREMIEFINNPNGTVSILIKNVGKIVNK